MIFSKHEMDFTILPKDILLDIYSHLSPETALKISKLNKHTYAAIQNNLFWQKKFSLHFPHLYEDLTLSANMTWYQKFKETYLAEYALLNPFNKHLISLVKEGDLSTLQTKTRHVYDLLVQDRSNNTGIQWAQNLGRQPILDYYYQYSAHTSAVEKIQWAIGYHQPSAEIVVWSEIFNDTPGFEPFTFQTAQAGNLPLLKKLLAKQPSLLEEKSLAGTGYTALTLATMHGHTDMVAYLLNCGADVNAAPPNHPHLTPLYYAAKYGYTPIVKLLLQAGAKTWSVAVPSDYHPIQLAAQAGHTPIVKHLLAKDSQLLNQAYQGLTPLSFAASYGHTETVTYLLSCGANIEAAQTNLPADCTVLSVAIHKQHNEIVELLLTAGAKLIPTSIISQYCPVHIAASSGNLFALKRLLTLSPELLELPTSLGHTPLITATIAGSIPIVEYLLYLGANIEASNTASLIGEKTPGKTALCFAISNNNLPLVDILLAAGAQTTVKTMSQDFQPLHLAINRGNLNIVQKLIGHNPALCTIRNSTGATPIQFAASNYQFAIVEYLLQASNKKQALNKLPAFKLTPKKQASQLSKYRVTENPAYYDLEQYIVNKKHHFHSPVTFFGAIANTLSTRPKKLAAAEALKAVISDQKDPAELKKHNSQFKHGKLGDIYHRLRKL